MSIESRITNPDLQSAYGTTMLSIYYLIVIWVINSLLIDEEGLFYTLERNINRNPSFQKISIRAYYNRIHIFGNKLYFNFKTHHTLYTFKVHICYIYKYKLLFACITSGCGK